MNSCWLPFITTALSSFNPPGMGDPFVYASIRHALPRGYRKVSLWLLLVLVKRAGFKFAGSFVVGKDHTARQSLGVHQFKGGRDGSLCK